MRTVNRIQCQHAETEQKQTIDKYEELKGRRERRKQEAGSRAKQKGANLSKLEHFINTIGR